MARAGVLSMRDVAALMGVTPRCAKRRLLKWDRKLGGGLLVQFAKNGHYFADLAALKRHLPGILSGDDEDPVTASIRAAIEVREMGRDALLATREVLDVVQQLAETNTQLTAELRVTIRELADRLRTTDAPRFRLIEREEPIGRG